MWEGDCSFGQLSRGLPVQLLAVYAKLSGNCRCSMHSLQLLHLCLSLTKDVWVCGPSKRRGTCKVCRWVRYEGCMRICLTVFKTGMSWHCCLQASDALLDCTLRVVLLCRAKACPCALLSVPVPCRNAAVRGMNHDIHEDIKDNTQLQVRYTIHKHRVDGPCMLTAGQGLQDHAA